MNSTAPASSTAPLDGSSLSSRNHTTRRVVEHSDKSKGSYGSKSSTMFRQRLSEGQPLSYECKSNSSPKSNAGSGPKSSLKHHSSTLSTGSSSETEATEAEQATFEATEEELLPSAGDVFGNYLQRLEAIHWESSSSSVASVLGEMLASVNDLSSQMEHNFDVDAPDGDVHQNLRQNIQEELCEINDIFSAYAERHPSICEDEVTAATLFEQLQALGYNVEYHHRRNAEQQE